MRRNGSSELETRRVEKAIGLLSAHVTPPSDEELATSARTAMAYGRRAPSRRLHLSRPIAGAAALAATVMAVVLVAGQGSETRSRGGNAVAQTPADPYAAFPEGSAVQLLISHRNQRPR